MFQKRKKTLTEKLVFGIALFKWPEYNDRDVDIDSRQ